MNILFWLYKSRVNKKGLTPVMMRITLHGQRINLPTQIEIEAEAWDHDRQRVKGSNDLAKAYNKQLMQLKTTAWDYYNEKTRLRQETTVAEIKQAVLGEDKPHHTLLEAIDYQISNLTARTHTDIAPSTVKKYETVRRKVVQFLQEEWKKEDLPLSQVSHQFLFELDTFMRVKQKLKNNGVAKNMQQLRRIIRVAVLNEWLDKDPFTRYQCKLVEPKRTCLTWDELQKLEAMALPNDRLVKVRDVFVFCCYTGLAFADVTKLSKEHLSVIDGKDWIVLSRTKTKNQSLIPLLPKAKELLAKYSGGDRLLPVISSQNSNKYLKEVVQLAGINKKVSFHAARHTFATAVTLNRGVDIITVSAMLGHKMLRTTQIYAKVNTQKIASDMQSLMGDEKS